MLNHSRPRWSCLTGGLIAVVLMVSLVATLGMGCSKKEEAAPDSVTDTGEPSVYIESGKEDKKASLRELCKLINRFASEQAEKDKRIKAMTGE